MKKTIFAAVIALSLTLAFCQGQGSATEQNQLASLEKSYTQTKAALGSHPKDKKARQQFVIAADRLATATMTAAGLSPHVKYPKALRLYREALKVDPTNREAGNNKNLIESIYKSMHRPIPK